MDVSNLESQNFTRFCPTCHTQELVKLDDTSFVCTWCNFSYLGDELFTIFQIRNKKIEDILS